jgi:starch phosphorylase
MYPERFQNKTNGVTPRRWLFAANPRLAAAISEKIGTAWVTNLDELRKLEALAEDAGFRARVGEIKLANKRDLTEVIERETGVRVDPTSMFSVQIKRFHEYKRQLLNLLHVIALYRRIKEGQDPGIARTVILAGKAAPGYMMAKLHIRLIHAVMEVINRDREVAPLLRLVFIPNYRVSAAEAIMPAADLSEQISTAGYEASGTGNMKLALNGALTIGTLDGANVEIREEVGADNFFLFGLDVNQVMAKRKGYHPVDEIGRDGELAMVLELIGGGFFAPEEPRLFQPIVDSLVGEDRYLVLADFRSYVTCQEKVAAAWRDPDRWQRMAIMNIARMGRFSSDRTIQDYARDIWGAQPVKVTLDPYTPP